MKLMPIAVSTMLTRDVTASSRRTRLHTQRSKVHQARESDDPVVHGVKKTATIELEEQLTLDASATMFGAELTRRPSASQ